MNSVVGESHPVTRTDPSGGRTGVGAKTASTVLEPHPRRRGKTSVSDRLFDK